MKTAHLLAALSVAVVGSSFVAMTSDAAVLRYRGSGDWSTISDGASNGWANNDLTPSGSVPGAADDGRVNFGGNTVTVTSSVPTVNRIQIGVDEDGNVIVADGGTLTGNSVRVGNNNADATGTLTVQSGGTLNSNGILWVGKEGSDGNLTVEAGGQVNGGDHFWWGQGPTSTATIDIFGTVDNTGGVGILGLGTNNASTANGGTGLVTIEDGGLLALSNIAGGLDSIQAGSSITINGSGQLTVLGDRVRISRTTLPTAGFSATG